MLFIISFWNLFYSMIESMHLTAVQYRTANISNEFASWGVRTKHCHRQNVTSYRTFSLLREIPLLWLLWQDNWWWWDYLLWLNNFLTLNNIISIDNVLHLTICIRSFIFIYYTSFLSTYQFSSIAIIIHFHIFWVISLHGHQSWSSVSSLARVTSVKSSVGIITHHSLGSNQSSQCKRLVSEWLTTHSHHF